MKNAIIKDKSEQSDFCKIRSIRHRKAVKMKRFVMQKKLILSVKSIAVLTAASLLLTAFHPLPLRDTTENGSESEGGYAPGEAIICVDPDVIDAEKTAKGSAGIFGKAPDIITDDLMDVSKAAADLKKEGNSSIMGFNGGKVVLKLVKSDTLSTEELIKLYSGKRGVLFAEPNYINKIETNDCEPVILTTTPASATPDMTDLQYAYKDGAGGMDVPDWNNSANNNAENTVVAVVDTGVDYEHEDLKGVMWNEGLKHKELTDLGGGEYGIFTAADNYTGDNIPDPRSDDPMDGSDNGHGTHCAGIVAAEWNGIGVSGAANGAKIMAVNISSSNEGEMYTSDCIEGYNYVAAAKDAGVNVVAANMSFGGPLLSLSEMVSWKELGKRDIVCCDAAGNEGLNNDIVNQYASILGNIPEVLVAGAGNRNGDPCVFSNYGIRTTHIFAPGYDFMSTVPRRVLSASEGINCSHPSRDRNGQELYDDFSEGSKVFSYEANSENHVELDFTGKALTAENISLGTGDSLTTETIKNDRPENDLPGSVLFTMSANSPLKELPEGKRYNLIIKTEVLEKGIFRLFCYVKKKDNSWERVCESGMSIVSGDYRYCIFPFEKMNDVNLNDLTIRTYLNSSETELKKGVKISEIWISDEEYNYSGYNGTSMATPAVTGEVAILAGKWPEDSGKKRAARVLAGAKTCESYKDICITGGMANVRNSLNEKKYTPVISSISADDDGLSVKGFFFGEKENTDVEIRQGSRTWAVSKGDLSIKKFIPSDKDENIIVLNIPDELENTEVVVTVTDSAKQEGRQSFSRFLVPDDSKGILKKGKIYSQIRLSDTALDTIKDLVITDGGAVNGKVLFSGRDILTGNYNFYALGDDSLTKAGDDIYIEGRWTTYNGMQVNAEGDSEHTLVFYDDGKKIKSLPLKSADKNVEELDEKDTLDLYYDGKDFLMIRSRFDKPVYDPGKKPVETLVYSLDPDTGLFCSLGSLNHGYLMSKIDTSGIVIAHEEREGKANSIYVAGFANDPEKGQIFTVERFRAEKGFKPEIVSVSENFVLGEAATDAREQNILCGCGVKNGIYITGPHETKNENGVVYVTADNYFLDYAHPEEGFKPCEKKIYDTTVYMPVAAAGYGKVYFFGLTHDGYVLSYTEADTLPHYGDRKDRGEDKAARNADGSWNYSKAQNAALEQGLRPLQKSTVEGAELEMSLFAREALFFNGNKKALTDSILYKEKSVVKVNGTEVKIKKVTLKNPKKAYISENSVFRDTIGEENLAVYASFKDKKKPGYYPALDTGGLSGDTKKAVKKINRHFKKNPIPIEILPITLTGSNVKVDKYDRNKGIVKKASVTYESDSVTKLKFNASGKKDFTSKTEDGIVTITGTNNYDGQLRYDPDSGNITPVQ